MSQTLSVKLQQFIEKAHVQFEKGAIVHQESFKFPSTGAQWLLREFINNLWGADLQHVMYFENIDQSKEFLGFGQVETFHELSAFRNHPDLPFLGFQHFAKPEHSDSLWKNQDKPFYQTPQLSLVRSGNEVKVSLCHKSRSPVDLKKMLTPTPLLPFEMKENSEKDPEEKKRYSESFQKAMEAIKLGELRKVVLSRRKFFQTPNKDHDWRAVLERFFLNAGNSFKFYCQNGTQIFASLTPERLFYLAKDRFETEAIAGTAIRGSTPEEDDRLFKGLLNDPKEMREHNIVIDDITGRLKKSLVRGGWIKKHQPLRLSHVQHIHSSFHGSILDPMVSLPLVAEKMIPILHPTPAVGGFPRELAIQSLIAWENYDRGPYAAPCTVYFEEEITVLVGLRCFCLHDNIMQVYAGSGIVEGSIEEKEWQETENKLKNYTHAQKS